MEATYAFTIDERLIAEALAAADLPLCRLLLRGEARFPWVVLVPRRPGVSESFDLAEGDRAALWAEADLVAAALKAATGAAKINLAAFGNMVPQLHVHVVARRTSDAAWPGSAVGLPRQPYPSDEPPPFWSALLSRLSLSARQSP
jgi:diadenosine tetraphosphate (Ap4A) HIT family hydrolase